MISISDVNPQGSKAPFDIASACARSLLLPEGLRPEVWIWNHGVGNPPAVGAMVFDQGHGVLPDARDRARVVAAQEECAASGSALSVYIGGDYGIYADQRKRRQVLDRYRGIARLGLDHVDGQNPLSGTLVWQALSNGFHVCWESNLERPWMRDTIRRFPGRVGIMAESWLWRASEPGGIGGVTRPNRFTIKSCLDLGVTPIALVCRRTSGRDDRLGYLKVAEKDWPRKKAELCAEFDAEGADVILRPAGMTEAMLAGVAELNVEEGIRQ